MIRLAREEAEYLGHDRIGTGHLLLGLLRSDDGIVAEALASVGVSVTDVRNQVRGAVHSNEGPPTGRIPFTPRAKAVLEFAFRTSRSWGIAVVTTQGVLFGLFQEADGVAARLLREQGIEFAQVDAAVKTRSMNHLAQSAMRDERVRLRMTPTLCSTCSGGESVETDVRTVLARNKLPGTWTISFCRSCGTTLAIGTP